MARTFGLTTGSERGTPGYDVTSPFMSGIKENIASTVPLALTAMNLKMDEEKAQAILGVRKEELARQVEKTKQDNLINQLKIALPIAYETKNQDMMAQLDPTFKAATGSSLPTNDVPLPVTGPENMDMPGTKREYVIPQTDAEKKAALQKLIYDLKAGNQESLNDFKMRLLEKQLSGKEEALRLSAVLKAAGVGAKDKLTITDIKSAHGMELQGIKNRMLVEMTPNEQADFTNLPPEQMLAALVAGKGKSLSPEKKQQYLAELQGIDDYYSGLSQEALGRKGAAKKPPKADTPKEEPQVRRDKAVNEYMAQYGDKYDQEEIYKALRGQYSDDEIKRGWRKYRGK